MITSLLVSALFQPQGLPVVKADELKRYVSYLASDELKGRGTPSPELIKASEYIAAELTKLGVQPGVGQSFFQSTKWERGRGAGEEVRNVIGLLPGSDPVLSKEYVVVSAHYDHLGEAKEGEDKIFNGANDDASGVAGVLGVAAAIAKSKPKRSIIFMAFYGEERGLVGSSFYAKNPVFPLKNTVAMLNIEQIGRTDDSEGPRVGQCNLTGFNFSTIGPTCAKVGKEVGVPVIEHPQFSAPYFMASDNAAFAAAGVPAHTFSVAYEFSDYHRVGDHADKLDYNNMAKITGMIAACTLQIANSGSVPSWNKYQKRVARYIEAYEKLQGKLPVSQTNRGS
jgi:hypothetical protein